MSLAVAPETELRPYAPVVVTALLVALGFFGAVAGWGMFARLDAAVVTYGVLHADSERKSVEHLEGGILAELLVRAGDRVGRGEVVARLDATQTRERLAQLRAEHAAASFAIWRLEAEAAGRAPDPASAPRLVPAAGAAPDGVTRMAPPGTSDGARAADAGLREARVTAELALHDARLGAHAGQVTALERQIDQLRAEIGASAARVRAAERQLVLWEEEREQVAELARRGAAPRQRLLEFDRAVAQAEGERDEYRGRVRAAEQDIARAESEIRALGQQRRVEIVGSLVDLRRSVEGLESQMRAAEDALARHALRASQAGRVVEITTVTPGAIIGPGEPLMTILPEDDELVALTQLPPTAIDSVRPGGPAEVRLTAYKRADAPLVPGTVTFVSADALESEDGETYFEARVTLDAEALAEHEGIVLSAGMPVEVSLTIGERRAGDYLLEPMLRHLRRAFREE
jgi:HlyD family secretion protein